MFGAIPRAMICFAAATATPLWPFAVLAICVAAVVLLIVKLRVHPFLALMIAALLAGILTPQFSPAQISKLPAALRADAEANSWIAAVELTAIEFGGVAGAIAISIGLAAIIGLALMESGAADKVVRRMIAILGEKRAALALLVSAYVLSIPIFFDTMFMLMLPLARALCLRTGKNYVLYLLAIAVGAMLTHSLTVPHPGPLGMIDNLRLDAGLSLIWGVIAGLLPCAGGFWIAHLINRRMTVPVREAVGVTREEMNSIAHKPEHELPSFVNSIMPVLLPIALISLASAFKIAAGGIATADDSRQWLVGTAKVFLFLGNKNIALLIGAALALWVLARQRKLRFSALGELLASPVETAGVIIIITAAGGAFGAMLRNAGVGDAIKALAQGYQMNLVLLSYFVALTIRFAQGSATVAMLTTSAMMYEVISGASLPYHPMYIFLAIGFGSFSISWMNDSGFWVVSRLSGLTERETLSTWTVTAFAVSIMGLIEVCLFSVLLPMK